MSSFLIGLVVTFVTGLVLRYLTKEVTKEIIPGEQGKYFLQMHASYKYVGYGSVILGAIITIGLFFIEKTDVVAIISIIGMFLFFVIVGILCILYYKRHYIIFDENSIQVNSIFNIIENFEWTVIRSGKLNKASGAIMFKTNDGRKFRVHQHLLGINKFFDLLKQKTGIVVDLSYK